MKAEATKLLKKPKALMILAAVGAVVLILVLGPTLILPRYKSWQNLRGVNEQDAADLSTLNDNVSALARIDKVKVAKYKELLSSLLPEEDDTLRAVSIIDQVAKNSGMAIESIQITISSKAQVTNKVATAPTGVVQATGGSQTVSSPQLKTSPSSALSPYTISLTLDGDFSSALGLINTLGLVKRTLNITSISFSKAASTEKAVINLTLSFPLATKTAASPEQKSQLASSQEKALDDLLDTLTIDANPSALPLGKTDPLSP